MNQTKKIQVPAIDLSAQIDKLKASGAHHFDPVRFRFIETMNRRAQLKDSAVKQLLDKKIQQSLSRYECLTEIAACEAERAVERIEMEFPNALAEAKSYQKSYQFKALKNLECQLRSQSGTSNDLAVLTKQLSELSAMGIGGQSESNLDSLLFDNVPDNASDIGADDVMNGSAAIGIKHHPELKSLKQYREQLAKVVSETMVRQIAQQSPENAGPLNPQHLAVRTLMAMKAISPDYLNRLVSYYDSLLWLDQAGSGSVVSKSKSTASKSKRKTRK